jgi:hypothetical protein
MAAADAQAINLLQGAEYGAIDAMFQAVFPSPASFAPSGYGGTAVTSYITFMIGLIEGAKSRAAGMR